MIMNFLNKHKTPAIVTGIGLFIAFMLGVAPTMKSDTPTAGPIAAAVVAKGEENSSQLQVLNERTSGIEEAVSKLGVMETQISTLNKAVSRTFKRVQSQSEALPDNLEPRLGAIESQVSLLDKAMSNTFRRAASNTRKTDDLVETVTGMNTHDIQLQTLNKAVSRLNLRIAKLEALLAKSNN